MSGPRKKNLGATTLKRRRRNANPMREFDDLPAELRGWLASAILPWSPRSAARAFTSALARTKDPEAAISELDRLQHLKIARDCQRIWGSDHPSAGAEN
ncbi:MAG: DUF6525 family protein [Pseudomonadota bacterium]